MAELRELVWLRAGGRCEITGQVLDSGWELHHRRPGGMGGTVRPDQHTAPNLLALTAEIHNGGPSSVHGHPVWSRPRGYLLSPRMTPRMIPLLLRGERWVLLTLDGRYAPLPASLTPRT